MKRMPPRWLYRAADGREFVVYDTSKKVAAQRIAWLLALPPVVVLETIERTERIGKAA